MNYEMKTSAILLAGGKGKRMGTPIPKQFLPLLGKTLVEHSFDTLLEVTDIDEVVVVCGEEFRHIFERDGCQKRIVFALPGERRQDSVYNGLMMISSAAEVVCIHDGARPCIDAEVIQNAIEAGYVHGASVVGVPIRCTIKESLDQRFVSKTVNRTTLWEAQTPQVARVELLRKGFALAKQEGLMVTDDVSLIELLGLPVKLVKGGPHNIKVTTPDDFSIVESLLERKESCLEI